MQGAYGNVDVIACCIRAPVAKGEKGAVRAVETMVNTIRAVVVYAAGYFFIHAALGILPGSMFTEEPEETNVNNESAGDPGVKTRDFIAFTITTVLFCFFLVNEVDVRDTKLM